MRISKIVSGAQTGADRGGLDAAVHCSLLCGGWVPKGCKAEDGVIPPEYLHLGLRETGSKDYAVRTEANVVDSDATVIFTRGELEGGSLKTADFARKHLKPCLHVDLAKLDRQKAVETVVEWLKASCPSDSVLNVAGQRESKSQGICSEVMVLMVDIISKVNQLGIYPLCDGYVPGDGDKSIDKAESSASKKNAEQEDEFKPLYHPKTIDEAVVIVMDELPPESKEEIRKSTDRELFRLDCHFGLAMWVRNALIHQNKNRIDLYADFQRGCREGRWAGSAEPDDVSGVICSLVWDRLHNA